VPDIFEVPLSDDILAHLVGPDPRDDPEPEPEEDEPEPLELTELRARLPDLIEKLDPIEQDIIALKLRGLNQTRIAGVLGMTQPGVSHRWSTARIRIKFWAEFERRGLSEAFIYSTLTRHGVTEIAARVLASWCHPDVNTQLEAALRVNSRQTNLSSGRNQAREKLAKVDDPDAQKVLALIEFLSLEEYRGARSTYASILWRERRARGERINRKPTDLDPNSRFVELLLPR